MLIKGFEAQTVRLTDVALHVAVGGSGPPLVLLHGYPQTHLMWHPIAADLAARFTVYAFDLPGYGRSSAPAGGPPRYAKRRIAKDIIGAMETLGVGRFALAAHDRGARVAYRLALDSPDRVLALALLDIVPTGALWDSFSVARAMTYYHWTFLAQPAPLPEMLIGGDPEGFLRHTMASWTKAKNLSAFDADAIAAYAETFKKPEVIAATCEDYRAGASVDWQDDGASRSAGAMIAAPTLVLWGAHFGAGGGTSPLEVWRPWAREVEGQAIDAGHFVVEENPAETRAALLPFLERYGREGA